MDFDSIGNSIESARNSPKFEDGLGDDTFSSLDGFTGFDSLDIGDLQTDKDSSNIDAFFNTANMGGGSFDAFGVGSSLDTSVNNSNGSLGGYSQQTQEIDSIYDKSVEAFAKSSKNSFNILKSILKSFGNRIADDWATFSTKLLRNSSILAGSSIIIWLLTVVAGKPISFLKLPFNSLMAFGLSVGSSFIILSGSAYMILRIDDKHSKIPVTELDNSDNSFNAESFYESLLDDSDKYSRLSRDDGYDNANQNEGNEYDEIDSILKQLYSEDDDNNDRDYNYNYNREDDNTYSYDSSSSYTEDDVFTKMLNKHSNKITSSNISSLVPANVPMINRAFLVDLFKPYLMSSTPDFSKEEHIDVGDSRFKDAEVLVLSAYASATGKEVEEISNKVYLDTMKETLFSYEFRVKRANSVRIQEDKLREEIEAYFKSDVIDDANPDAGSVSATIVKDKDYFRVSVTKPNLKTIISLGDCMQRSNVIEFFKDTSVHLPIIVGITDKGNPVLEDAKIYDATMIAGKQRSGKSWYVSSYVMQLQLFNTPEDVQFLYIDPKESFMFKSLSLMPHCCGLHTHHRILDILQDIIDLEAPRRKKLLQDNRCETIWDLRKKGIKLPVLYIVIDEYMTVDGYLNDRVSVLQTQMREIMSQMPSLGVRLIFIPHRAQGVVDKTARSLINYAAAVKTENSIIEETLDVKKWTRKLSMPGDIALRLGSRSLYVRGAVLETSDDATISFITEVAKSYYKMGVEIHDMKSIGTGYNRNEAKIKEELDVVSGNKIQYDANKLNSELSSLS